MNISLDTLLAKESKIVKKIAKDTHCEILFLLFFAYKKGCRLKDICSLMQQPFVKTQNLAFAHRLTDRFAAIITTSYDPRFAENHHQNQKEK